MKKSFDHDQLHMAISLYLAARFTKDGESHLWDQLMGEINKGKVPKEMGRVFFIKNIQIGSSIIYAYAIENLIKAFSPQIGRRHINISDLPVGLNFSEVEALVVLKTLLPMINKGVLRYPEPQQDQYFLDPTALGKVFVKIFKYFTNELKLNVKEIKCFKVEFLQFNYPYIEDLL